MRMFEAKTVMATVVVAMIMMLALMPQSNANPDNEGKTDNKDESDDLEDMPDVQKSKNFVLNYCGSIVDKITEKIPVAELQDRKKVFEVGYKKMKPVLKKLNRFSYEMAKSWKRVRLTLEGKQECKSDAAKDVMLLMICFNMGVLNDTLGKDVREYNQKCTSSPQYWEQKYNETLKHAKFPKEDHEKVKKFVNEDFVKSYFDENRIERISFLGDCCQPKRAWKPTFDMFKHVGLDAQNNPSAVTALQGDPDKIEDIYNRVVLEPCKGYLGGVAWLFAPTAQVSQIMEGGSDEFLQSLSESMKLDVFRYRFCLSIVVSPDSVQEQLRGLAWNVLYPGLDYGRVNCYA